MYNQQIGTQEFDFIPEFVYIFAKNTVKIMQDFAQTDIHFKYNSETDTLTFIFEPIYNIKFAYKMNNITKTLVQTRTTVAMTGFTIIKKYKRHILGKFFKDSKNP